MNLALTLSTDERIALRRFAATQDLDLERAAAIALRDWLIAGGCLETVEFSEDTETAGEA